METGEREREMEMEREGEGDGERGRNGEAGRRGDVLTVDHVEVFVVAVTGVSVYNIGLLTERIQLQIVCWLFEPWVSLFTVHCSSSPSCMKETCLQSVTDSLCTLIAAQVNASH